MELIRSAARRTRLGEVGYVALNVLYAAMLLVLLLVLEGQPYLAYLLVLLGKWRIFAVRPRFWLTHIQANALDTLVGLSVVTLLWLNMGNLPLQLVLTAFFAVWLTVLKPSSKPVWVAVQGAVAQFMALSALFTVAHMLQDAVVVLAAWLIGFVVARHVVAIFSKEFEDVVLSMTWGVVVAELSWLLYHWTIAYTAFKIPQVSLLMTLLGYLALVTYNYLYQHENMKNFWRDLSMPILFSLAGIALLVVFFNTFDPTSL